jgi:hypothetical protein
MRYMMLVYSREDLMGSMSQEEMQQVAAGHGEVMAAAWQQGILEGAEPLQATSVATTVRVQHGQILTTDGPFAETKEQLAGYYILNCKDLDEAISWAARIPTACAGGEGSIEIRPLRMQPTARDNHAAAANAEQGAGHG